MSYIPYARQHITQADIQSVVDVLQHSDWLTQGPAVERFEQALAEYCGARYAVAVNSATSALHIACKAAGLGAGDELWTSPNTFVASANCALYCGAGVDFVDIDERTYNMSIDELRIKLEKAASKNKLPKVVVPVHFAGQSCDMDDIYHMSKQYGFQIIEDASHAIGGRYKQTQIGCCQFSDMTVFSFHPVKIITSGEGGMILTNNRKLYEKLVLYRSHGITRDTDKMQRLNEGPWYYEQVELGYNYRMTDIQAALGSSQAVRVDEFVQKRHEIAARYNEELADLPVTLPYQSPNVYSALHLYVIRLRLDQINKSHRQIFEELRKKEILVNLHYIPVHTQPYYQRFGFKYGDFPQAEKYYQEAISIPIFYGLTADQQDYVIAALKEVIR